MDMKFIDKSKEALEALKQAKKNSLWAIGAAAEGYAKEATPVDTGRLRNSITHAEDSNNSYIGTNVEYAPYVELGTKNQHAHHMLKKAATEHAEEYRNITKAAMKGE